MKSYICKSCGAELIVNDKASFTTCLYCGNNIALTNKEIGELNIKKIIPFEIEKDEAINKFNKIIKKNIIEAKKVYVPVRFCNYEFDFLMYYEYVIEDDENGDKYVDKEELIDGKVENEIVFSNSKIKSIFLPYELRNKERLNFDPILLKDVSIEYSSFDSIDLLKGNIKKDIVAYSYGKIRNKVSSIYSMNYFPSNIDLESFSTLIPVYIMKTNNGEIYNIPGVKPVKLQKSKRKKLILLIFSLLILFLVSFPFLSELLKTFFTGDNGSNNGKSTVLLFFMVFLFGPILGIIIYLYKRNNKFVDKSYDNFKYKKYSFGNHRKSLK